jgi:hypothetical protein
MPRAVSAEIGPYLVSGTVTDSAGRPIVGAGVVVVMMNGATEVDIASDTTDSNGFYTVSFATDNWEIGFSITSTATFNSVQVSDTIPADEYPVSTINLQFLFEIPQFGSILGFVATAGLVGVVAVVFLAKKSK